LEAGGTYANHFTTPSPACHRRALMSWFRVDDTLAAHPKTRRAGLAAMGLWTVAGSWSSQQLTEGFIPEWFVATWPQGKTLARRLVLAELWDEAKDGDERGWLFHDWTDANPTAEKEKERRRKARDRQRRLREKSAAKREEALDKALDESLSRGTSRVTDSVSHGAPSRPDPSRSSLPTEETSKTSQGGVTEVVARASNPPLYPDHCPDHQVAVPPPCGGCQKQKAANKARAEALPDYRLRVVPPLCGECDERWIETPTGLAKCPRCYPTEMRTA
jgi:hypothetical protein